MDIEDFNVVFINLESRPDRRDETKEELAKAHLLSYSYRFTAVVNTSPIVSCADSHFKVLEDSLLLDKNAMVFEDDVKFINNYEDLWKYLKELDNLDWDMLYLGANITQPIEAISDKFARIRHAQSTHAYCVSKKFIPFILEHKNLIGKHMDLIYAEDIIPSGNCYITIPMLAIQRPSFSNIEKKQVDYSWMEKRYWENLERNKG